MNFADHQASMGDFDITAETAEPVRAANDAGFVTLRAKRGSGMNSKSRATLLCLLALSTIFSIAVRVHGQGQGQAASAQAGMNPPGPPKSAEQVYKNIQVLKGVPAQQIMPAMQFVTASLGVQCEFCHVEGKFDQDDKKSKQTARKMMQMMFAIDKDNFDGHREVTCYSCHQGTAKPVDIPLITEAEVKPALLEPLDNAEPSAVALPNSDEILDKYLNALGGAKALLAIRTLAEKGSATFGGYEVPIEIYAKAPDKRTSLMHMNGAENTTIYDGTSAWAAAPGRGLREMYGADLDAARMDAEMLFPGNIKQLFPDLKISGTEKPERLRGISGPRQARRSASRQTVL
jgi:hypothetical protein